MVSKVYFADFKATSYEESTVAKIRKLFEKAGFAGFIKENDLVAVKVHFGERGNDGYVNPVYVRQAIDKIKECGAKPFVTDTNTLYVGSRHNAVDHLTTALEHGFNYTVLQAPITIADGLKGGSFSEVDADSKHFKKAKIAADILAADAMIVMTHVKGHPMAGFGGSIKNIAMGCAPAEGKKAQHSLRPTVEQSECVSCGACVKVCPVEAISLASGKAFIDKKTCIGCADCVSECPVKAIKIIQKGAMEAFTERMVEYAKAALTGKEGRVGYINIINKVSPGCDCFDFSDRPLVPDIGILASTDIVAIDKASVDLINRQVGFENSALTKNHEAGCDKFIAVHPETRGDIQTGYGEEIGLGSQEYELIKI